MENVVGDVVVAAGCIAYSGPFTPAFRQQLQLEWAALLEGAAVPHTSGTNLIGTLQVKAMFQASLNVMVAMLRISLSSEGRLSLHVLVP